MRWKPGVRLSWRDLRRLLTAVECCSFLLSCRALFPTTGALAAGHGGAEASSPAGVFGQWAAQSAARQQPPGQSLEGDEEGGAMVGGEPAPPPSASAVDEMAHRVPSSDDPVFHGPFGLAVGVAEAADEAEEEEEELGGGGGGGRRHRGRRNRPGKTLSGSTKAPY